MIEGKAAIYDLYEFEGNYIEHVKDSYVKAAAEARIFVEFLAEGKKNFVEYSICFSYLQARYKGCG
jgi:hypothetical protein